MVLLNQKLINDRWQIRGSAYSKSATTSCYLTSKEERWVMEDKSRIDDSTPDETENYSNTPYDDAFRTMIGKSGSL